MSCACASNLKKWVHVFKFEFDKAREWAAHGSKSFQWRTCSLQCMPFLTFFGDHLTHGTDRTNPGKHNVVLETLRLIVIEFCCQFRVSRRQYLLKTLIGIVSLLMMLM